MKRRILNERTVFVFGSNLVGLHGKGSALHAAKWLNAKQGVGEGPMYCGINPTCYGIPTKVNPGKTLTLKEISIYVDNFKNFALENSTLLFQVTRIGCGLAGYSDSDISPMFVDAPINCMLPGVWTKNIRLIVAGSRSFTDKDFIYKKLTNITKFIKAPIEVVSGLARGPDTIGLDWGLYKGFDIAEFPANWDKYKKSAGHIRNSEMAWYGTHLIAFWDGLSSGTANMIDLSNTNKIQTRVITFK